MMPEAARNDRARIDDGLELDLERDVRPFFRLDGRRAEDGVAVDGGDSKLEVGD